jgi:hypothetical protein
VVLPPCRFAVRRLKTSPYRPACLGSVSYDMSFRMWDSKVREDRSRRVFTPKA